MPIELSIPATIALNALGLPAVQLGCAWLFTRLPATWFDRPGQRLPAGRRLDRLLRVKRWKDKLPDGAAWFRGGFAKANLPQRDPRHLRRFAAETRRGELCHWTALTLIAVFFLWNPWWADLVIAAYALAANLPCILVQRHNRRRLLRVLRRRATSS